MDTKKIIELGGTISFDDISHINQLADTSMIVDELKEDLFQAVFPHNQLIDIGWHPEFSEKGTFRISLIKEYDWEHPVFSEKAKSWTELNKAISNALNKLKNDNQKYKGDRFIFCALMKINLSPLADPTRDSFINISPQKCGQPLRV